MEWKNYHRDDHIESNIKKNPLLKNKPYSKYKSASNHNR